MALRTSLLKFYKGKSVLVTGHTGFKGAWLATWLKMMGSRVCGVALPPHGRPNLFTAAALAEQMESHFCDIRDLDAFSRLLQKHQPDIVIHNAAQALVLRSYQDPVDTYSTNVMGTVNILQAARQVRSVRSVVVITSDKCYENREWIWGYRENEALGGRDPYSSSKACAELVTAAFRSSFFTESSAVSVASARAGNVVGGGDWAENRLIPDLIRGISHGSKITIRNPQACRPWQHVLEPLQGYLLLAERLFEEGTKFASAWNFGPNENLVPVKTIASRIIELWGAKGVKIAAPHHKLHEAQHLVLDSSKAQAELGWRPLLSLDETLRWTVEWYRGWERHTKNANALTHDQIQRYMDRLC